MKKRVLSVLMALTLVLGLLPSVTPHVHGSEAHTCVDNDRNHHCDDDGCRKYIPCYDTESADDDDRCDLCGACLTPVDEDEDNVCDNCGTCVSHTFVEEYWHTEDRVHYPECDRCYYYNYAQGTACADGDGDALCDVCGDCADGEHSCEWDGGIPALYTHWIACKDCGAGFEEDHADGEDEDAFCDVCGSCIDGEHGSEVWNKVGRDDTSHEVVCEICGAAFGWMEHSDEGNDGSCDVCRACMNGWHSYEWDGETWNSADHWLACKNCGMDGGWEAHYDGEDDDELCDVCGYETHEHTYTEKKYYMDSDYHYAMCDTCGHWDGLNCDLHEDSDSDCSCDVCEYSMHQIDQPEDQGDGNHQGVCIVCEETATMPHIFDLEWDDEGHWCVCECGAVEANSHKAHTFKDNYWHSDNQYHYPECDVCGYHQPEGQAHDLTGEEGKDKVCSICDHIVHNYVWDGETWDPENHWVVCGNCGYEDWEGHYDGEDADELCDACSFNLACPHEDTEEMYDDNAHWDACTACRQSIFSPEFHSFDDQDYFEGAEQHYPKCDGCDYYKEAEGEAHVDEGEDGYCDVCDFWIHEHTYEYEYWAHDDGKHYLVCDLCDKYDRTTGEACTDTDNDHRCDVCRTHLEDLCYDKNNDTDGNHRCDVCRYPMTDLCDDIDNDHVCDAAACQRHMKELCSAHDENSDWLCDICGKNFCNHYFDNEPLTNNDGTHKLLCRYCGEVTEDCYADMYDSISDNAHTVICRCGYKLPTEAHVYGWVERSVTGHRMACDDCSYEKEWEVHTTQNGVCEACKMQVTTYCDVYLGGVGLEDRQYLDNSGNLSPTQPEGGYAYYEDGVLELNGYVYDGPGFLWSEYESGEPDWAALYATKDLTLVLKGENSLQITRPDAAEHERNYSDGITTEKDLTIRGDGSLSIQVNDDGVQTSSGDVTIEGGTLTVNAEDHGFDVIGSVTVTGGTVDVTAGDEGFNVDEDITISGGEILIDAEAIGLDASDSVTISGGTVEVAAKDDDGIQSSESVRISGGSITIDAAYCGIFAYEGADISGGDLVIHSERDSAIHADGGSVTISGGNLDLTSGSDTVVVAYEDIFVEGYAQLPEGVVIEEDEAYGRWFITVADGHLSIVTPFSAELKEDGIHLTGSPWSLKVVFAAYNSDGKMLGIHVVEEPGNVVPVPDLDGTVIAFFLNSRSMPVNASLPIE